MSHEFTEEQISIALSNADIKIIELLPYDERLANALDLLINTSMHLLEHPEDTLDEAITTKYLESPAEVRSWIGA